MRRVIYLWGPSRSVSTAMQKAFQQRKDSITVFEPFADTYYFSRERYTRMYGDRPEVFDRDFSTVLADLAKIESEIVFVKEMSYFVTPYATEDFYCSGTHSFIIRHPVLTLASRKRIRMDEIGEHEFGFTAVKQMWDMLTGLGRRPPIVDGEQLRKHPEPVLRAYCAAVEVPFDSAMLSWSPGPIREFEAYERESHARWHQTLDQSSGFIAGAGVGDELRYGGLTDAEHTMLMRAIEIYEELSPHAINGSDSSVRAKKAVA